MHAGAGGGGLGNARPPGVCRARAIPLSSIPKPPATTSWKPRTAGSSIATPAPLRTSDGKYLGRIWFFRDITQDIRRAKEKELQNFRFEAALNNMTQGLCMFDRDKRLVVSNRQYAEMYGISPEDVRPGMPLEDVLRQRLEAGNEPIGGSQRLCREPPGNGCRWPRRPLSLSS